MAKLSITPSQDTTVGLLDTALEKVFAEGVSVAGGDPNRFALMKYYNGFDAVKKKGVKDAFDSVFAAFINTMNFGPPGVGTPAVPVSYTSANITVVGGLVVAASSGGGGAAPAVHAANHEAGGSDPIIGPLHLTFAGGNSLVVDVTLLVTDPVTNRVGIGTASPTATLDVVGNLKVSTTIAATGALSGSNFSGSSSGTNTGNVTIGAVGAAPNANGATLAGQALNLEPASATFPGVMTTGAQTIAGAKTFSGAISASNLSGTNTGDITLAAVGATPNANGATLVGQALNLEPASVAQPGVITTGAQSIAGAKSFTSQVENTSGGYKFPDATVQLTAYIPANDPYREVAVSGAVSATDMNVVTVGNAAAVTLTLPAANTVATGHKIRFKDGDGTASLRNLTIARSGADTIDGQTSQVISVDFGSVTLVCNGVSKWFIV